MKNIIFIFLAVILWCLSMVAMWLIGVLLMVKTARAMGWL